MMRRLARLAGDSTFGMDRRRFLETTLAVGAAMLLPARLLRAAGKKPRVVVIGAGLGGLSAGHQLHQAGADVTLLEARNRTGGRVLSNSRFIPGVAVEMGGEFIGSNHPIWVAQAKRFGLELVEVPDEASEGSPILLGGRKMLGKEASELWEALEEAMHLMNTDARKVNPAQPWKSPEADKLDRTSLREAATHWSVGPSIRDSALLYLSNDNALSSDTASYLGVLSAIAGGGIERFWEESETHRCRGGSQQLAECFAREIGSDRIQLGTPVESVELTDSGAVLQTRGGKKYESEAVILSTPPTVWDRIVFQPSIPSDFRPHVGAAIKVLAEVLRQAWEDAGLNPNSLTDQEIGMTWQGGDQPTGKESRSACLVGFSGGRAAEKFLQLKDQNRKKRFEEISTQLFQDYPKYAGKNAIMAWPEEPWTQGGYSSPLLGQVTTVFPKLEEGVKNRLFFAGEHTSPSFYGYMEGALQSGVRAAQQVIRLLNLKA